jgi:hypothetical protein
MKFSSRFECLKDCMLEGRLFHGTREDGGGHRVHIPTGTCSAVVVSPYKAILAVAMVSPASYKYKSRRAINQVQYHSFSRSGGR